ncbi:unnamed protein product [Paramecium primaurelia]|uniref:Uncharacterized protein n=1 Tax=Paramecium primaurelia TaxID=5886 RepID=A0A8S1LBW8_PARPR|nr:unnamed protein product [Paramecium primaurelia]
MDSLFETNLPFSTIPIQQYGLNQLIHYSRNQSLQKSDFSPQQMLLDLGEMCNVRYLLIENLKYGCEISVFVSEFKNGPFISVHNKEFFPQHKQRRIKLAALPCRYIRILIHKGVHIQTNQIKLIGSTNERLAEEGYFNDFKLLVTNPSRIMY